MSITYKSFSLVLIGILSFFGRVHGSDALLSRSDDDANVLNTNNVFFFVGSPLALLGATVELYGDGFYESFVTSDPFSGEYIADVPYGTYTYSVSKSCYDTVTGTVIVDFNDGMGVSVFATPSESSTNDVFFFVGSPLAMLDATVELYGDGFYQSFVTSDPWSGEFIADVPYGTYTYSVSKACHETVTGTVEVTCNDGMGVSVFATPTAISIDSTVTVANGVLFATAANWAYQWVDCDNGNAEILGATGATFAPSATGNYAVVISAAGCSETSACVEVSANTGCTYPDAINYDASASIDDGSCTFELATCMGDLNGDGLISAQDLLSFLSVFGSDCAE